jgi:hypothetical protein
MSAGAIGRRDWPPQAKGRSEISSTAASSFRFEFMTVSLDSKEEKKAAFEKVIIN